MDHQEIVGSPARSSHAQFGSRPPTWVWAGAGIAVLLVVGIVIGVTSGSDDDESDAPAASGDSSHNICVKQVLAIAGNLADNQAYDVEMTINGGEDPFLDVGNRIAGKYLSEQYQIGRKAAFDNSVEAANDACSGQLNDQIRPNYPTDGTSG